VTGTDWPFETDADRDDPLTALRIPVTSACPGWRYVACFDRESEQRPTDLEAQQLASFIEEYVTYWFNDRYIAKLRERPLDVDSGCPIWIFHKWGEGDWSYRVDTWVYGPFWSPVAPRLRHDPSYASRLTGPRTLVEVMDRIRTIADEPVPRWTEWKAAHPEVFPEAPDGH
jgi:hypothetical protein